MMGQLSAEEIEQLLWSEVVAHLGCHVEDRVYVVPVQYVYDGRSAYLHGSEGLKLSAMRKDPRVCFEVDQVNDLSNWRSVICSGSFEELHGDESERARKLIVTRIAPLIRGEPPWPVDFTPKQGGPFEARERGRSVYYRLLLSEKTGRFEKGGSVPRGELWHG